MKKLILIIVAMFGLNVAFGQVTIIKEDFDSATKTWNYTTGASRYSYSNKYNGVKSLGLRGTSTTAKEVTFDNVDITGYTDVTLSVAYASYKVDSGEDLIMYIYYDGHTSSDVSKKLIDGNSNYSLNINTIGSAARTPQGANPYTFTVPAGHTSIKVKFIGWGIESGEYYYVDDVELKGTLPTTDTDTEVYDTGSQPTDSNIASVTDTPGEAVPVFGMTIEDNGSGDTLPTKVTNIRLKPHTTNSADWTDTIQGFVVDKDGTIVTPASITITDTAIDFAFTAGDLDIADGTSSDINFKVYLNTSNILDQSVLSFMVDADDHGFTTDTSGSDFKSDFFLGDFNSNNFTIEVEATELQFTQQPSDVDALAVMSPAVTVAYTDVNGNIDIDDDGLGVTATLSATGATLSASTTTDGTPVDGVMTFSDIKFNTTGTGVTLTVTDSGGITGTSITSTAFDVTGEQEIEIEGATNGNIIVAGNTVPEEDNDTLFGLVSTDGVTSTQTYTIKNLGVLDLVLTDPSPYISIVGTGAGDFSVSVIPTTPIAGSSSVNFEITFDPSEAGVRYATINIANNDANEDPYSFDIQGTGYDPCTQLFISEYAEKTGGNYIEIYNPTNADVDMANFQVWRGYNGGAWTSADVIALSGTLAGGNVYVVAKDAADIPYANKYDSHLNFNGDDNIGLAYDDGSGTFTLIDAIGDENGDPGTGWDVAGVANGTVNHTLVRKASVDYANTDWDATAGTDALNSEWVVLDYTTTTQLYHVSDCQNIPLMAVVGHLPGAGNDELVIDEDLAGAQTPKKSNNTLFKNTAIGNTTINAFRIYNAGTADLSLTGSPMVAISGTDADQFSISTNPTSPVGANNGHTDFEITFTPTTEGIKTATISIANNNPFENPYTFTIQGTGYTACSQLFISEYAEKTGGNYIEIYNPTNADVDMTNFQVWRGYNGGAWSGADVIALSGTLVPGNVFIIARDASEIEFANQYDSHLNFNGNDNIGLAYDDGSGTFALIDSVGDATGNPGTAWDVAGVANATLNHTLVRKASVDYANTDWDAASGTDAINSEWIVLDYTTNTQLYHVSDCQQIPLMAVVGHLPGAGNDELVIDELLAGPQTPKASNNTLFEDQQVGVTTVSHTFRIYNAGNTDLSLNGSTIVEIIGANPGDFTVTTLPASSVDADGGHTDFVIEFNPIDYGVRTAVVKIVNNNPFENPYVFTIKGTGLNYTACNTHNSAVFFDDFEDDLNDWIVINDPDADANVVISGDFNGANGTANAALFDAPNAPNTYYVSSIEKTFTNTNQLILDFSYFFEDYRGGQITVYVNNTVVYNIYTENSHNNGTDLQITDTLDDTWSPIRLDLIPFTLATQDYTIKIEGEAKTKNSDGWKDRVLLDELKVSRNPNITYYYDNGDSFVWSNDAPTRTVKAIIDANYDTANGNIEACACKVNSGATLTVNAGEHLLIETDFENNGTVEVKDKGSIVQHKEDALVTGADKFKIHKTTATYASYDYIYWSSPMTTDTFDNVFNANLAASEGRRIYSFNTANFSDADNDTFDDDGDDWNMVDFGNVMTPGIGYIVMGTGSSFPLTNPLTTSSQTQSVVFLKGVINNGDITVPVVLDAYNVAHPGGNGANTNSNLIGNPYPSAIDIKKLNTQVYNDPDNTDGVLSGTFYFWTHDDPIGSGTNNGPDLYNFSNDDYSVATVDFGGVFSATQSSNSEGPGPYTASEYISSGQGFFADAHKAGVVKFTNNMRITDHNDTFRNTQDANNNLDRVWLNLTKNDRGIFRQIMVGFHDNATDGFVNGQDGARMENGSNTDFYSIIPGDTKHYAIQNLSTFNTSKTVDLGLEIIEDGTYEIDIDHVVGVFAEDQIVYLQDNETDTIWDLTNNGAYQFVATIGDNINNRFVLRFTTTALGIADNSVTTQIIVAQNEQSFNLSTSDKTAIKSASVFNTIGQQLGYYKANNGEIQIPTSNINQGTVLFISVTLDNGTRLTKKVVKL